MKGLLNKNGQPYLNKEGLDWATGCIQGATRERLLDLVTPGVVYGSGGTDSPFKITPGNGVVSVGPGVAISGGGNWPEVFTENADPGLPANPSGERIVVPSVIQAWDRNETSETGIWHVSPNGLGTDISTPQTSGNSDIPVVAGTNYVWIAYLKNVDTSKTLISKLDTSIIYPYTNDGYDIVINTSATAPDGRYMLLGSIVYSGTGLVDSTNIDQTGMAFSTFRDDRVLGDVLRYQVHSHSNGLYGTDPFPAELSGSEWPGDQAVLFKLESPSNGDTEFITGSYVYINGRKDWEVFPNVAPGSTRYAYSSFSSSVPAGEYYVYIEKLSTGVFQVNKSLALPSGVVPLALVNWTGSDFGDVSGNPSGTKIVDQRPGYMGLTGASNIQNSAVVTAKLADLNVTTAKLADGAITTVKIDDLNITTAKINDDAVESAKLPLADPLAPGAYNDGIEQNVDDGKGVKTGHIKNRAIKSEKIDQYTVARDRAAFSIADRIRLFVQGTLEETFNTPVAKALMDKEGYINKVFVRVDVLPASPLKLDVRKNGTSIFTSSDDMIVFPSAIGAYDRFVATTSGPYTLPLGGGTGTAITADTGYRGTIKSGAAFADLRVHPGDYVTLHVMLADDVTPGGDDLVMTILVEDYDQANSHAYDPII
jgi:hypothetical protein